MADGGETALRYFIADRYVEAFQAMAASPNSRLVVVPMEASALAGGITQALSLLQAGAGRPAAAARRAVCMMSWSWRYTLTSLAWLGVGLALLVAELLVPGVFLMWIGLAAMGTGGAAALGLHGFGLQVVVFRAAVGRQHRARAAAAQAAGAARQPAGNRPGRPDRACAGVRRPRGAGAAGRQRLAGAAGAGAAAPAPAARLRVVGVRGVVLLVQPLEG